MCNIYKLGRILLTVGGWRAGGGWRVGGRQVRRQAVPPDTLEKWTHPTSSSNKKSLYF